jgi:hypothetical protein
MNTSAGAAMGDQENGKVEITNDATGWTIVIDGELRGRYVTARQMALHLAGLLVEIDRLNENEG